MCHTHTPCLWQGGATEDEVKIDEDEGGVKVRWPWRWDEEILSQDAKRGTQKKKERTPTQHTWPGAGKPWKGKGKEKRRVDGHGTRPAEGGKDESAWTNLTRREPTHTSARDGTDLPEEGRTHRGPMGISWWKHKKEKQDSVPKYPRFVRYAPPGPCSGQPQGHVTAVQVPSN